MVTECVEVLLVLQAGDLGDEVVIEDQGLEVGGFV